MLVGAEGKAAVALRFLIFTVCGTNEVTGARWDEIDRPRAVWKIPGERMKMDEDHSVPLTAPALAILDEMRDGGQGDLIFPAADDQPFSDMAMLAVLDRLGYGHVTVHGFRAMFATWAEECTDYPDGVREKPPSRTNTKTRPWPLTSTARSWRNVGLSWRTGPLSF